MNFDEEYPSLVKCWEEENGPSLAQPQRSFQEWRIKKTCTDNQKIRDAIKKNGTHMGSDEIVEPICLRILKELGLE